MSLFVFGFFALLSMAEAEPSCRLSMDQWRAMVESGELQDFVNRRKDEGREKELVFESGLMGLFFWSEFLKAPENDSLLKAEDGVMILQLLLERMSVLGDERPEAVPDYNALMSYVGSRFKAPPPKLSLSAGAKAASWESRTRKALELLSLAKSFCRRRGLVDEEGRFQKRERELQRIWNEGQERIESLRGIP